MVSPGGRGYAKRSPRRSAAVRLIRDQAEFIAQMVLSSEPTPRVRGSRPVTNHTLPLKYKHFKSIAPTLRENQLAPPKYTMEETCDPTVTVNTYVDEVKDANIAIWADIANDLQVKSALSAVATMGDSNTNEFHHATSYLLNCISHAYLKAKAKVNAPSSHAEAPIVFSSARDKCIPGDYLDTEIKPDLTAFSSDMAKLAEALSASGDSPFAELVNFPLNLSFGQCQKQEPGGLDQLLSYLSALKRARPDLATVTGLFLDDSQRLVLVSINACGAWSSQPVNIGFQPVVSDAELSASGRKAKGKDKEDNEQTVETTIPSTDTWISYVVLLYRAHQDRNTNFSLIDTNATPARAHWQVIMDKYTPTVRPFHATLGPGRMTWASFALEPQASHSNPSSSSPSLANGFFKTSWQDVDAEFHESKLLELAHKNTWLPGLVRHWSTALDTSRQVSLHNPPVDSSPILQAEHVYLASIGHPLSRCESALHLLKTIYDAAETHLQLIRRGVLHGDMSWFNVLCNPWHHEDTLDVKPVAEGIPCIDFILTGKAESQPCALVLDLDHGADIKALYDETAVRYLYEKSGTPMFVSIELSSEKRVCAGTFNNLTALAQRLGALDERPELFARAFPGKVGDNNFMANFRRVVELERVRMSSGVAETTDPDEAHGAHHDVESLYWILVWGFSRACPSGHSPHGAVGDDLSHFVDAMLRHRLGGSEEYRSTKLYGFGLHDDIFHPLLRDAIFPVLRDLASYLAIPWRLYDHIVKGDHAHVAIRRLLLPLIYDIHKEKVRNIFFNIEQPRTAVTTESAAMIRLCPSNHGTQVPASAAVRAASKVSAQVSESARVSAQSARVSASARMSASARGSAQASAREIKSNSRCKPRPVSEALSETTDSPSTDQGAPSVQRAEGDPDFNFEGGDVVDLLQLYGKRRREGLLQRGAGVVGATVSQQRDEADEPAHKRAKKDGREERGVDALIDMFRDDRKLWFGSGFRSEAEAKAVVGP